MQIQLFEGSVNEALDEYEKKNENLIVYVYADNENNSLKFDALWATLDISIFGNVPYIAIRLAKNSEGVRQLSEFCPTPVFPVCCIYIFGLNAQPLEVMTTEIELTSERLNNSFVKALMEIQRRNDGKSVAEVREKQRDKELREAAEARRKQKEEDALLLKKLREQIRQDKEERVNRQSKEHVDSSAFQKNAIMSIINKPVNSAFFFLIFLVNAVDAAPNCSAAYCEWIDILIFLIVVLALAIVFLHGGPPLLPGPDDPLPNPDPVLAVVPLDFGPDQDQQNDHDQILNDQNPLNVEPDEEGMEGNPENWQVRDIADGRHD